MTKDWTGNTNSVFKQLGASNHTDEEREQNDYYATDPKAITSLLRFETNLNNSDVWECAVGGGHLADRLKEHGCNVKCSDIIDRGYPNTEIIDFLNYEGGYVGNIITNPPYKYCAEFINKALKVLRHDHICEEINFRKKSKVCMLLKLTTLESRKRYEQVFKKNPPQKIYVFVDRLECAKNGEFKNSSAVCYAWFVWEVYNHSIPEVYWID